MLTLALATSLYAASLNPPQPKEVAPLYPVRVEKIANPLATDLAFIGVGLSLDLYTTSGGIRRGCYEANPLGPDAEARVALKIGTATLRASTAFVLRRYGRHKAANVLRYVGGAVDVGLAVNNYRCGR